MKSRSGYREQGLDTLSVDDEVPPMVVEDPMDDREMLIDEESETL